MAEFIGGRHAVYHAIIAGRRQIKHIWLREGAKSDATLEIISAAGQRGIPVETAPAGFFAKKVRLEVHQGVAAEAQPLPRQDFEDWLASDRPPQRLLLLDGIEDPQNLGSLLRTALCFGMQGVVWSQRRSAPLSAVAVKAAAGAVEYLSLSTVPNLAQAMVLLKEAGYWIYGAAAEGEQILWDLEVPPAAALVIGGEGKGLHRLVKDRCDVLIQVPIKGPLGSLNASVAGGVLMSHFSKA